MSRLQRTFYCAPHDRDALLAVHSAMNPVVKALYGAPEMTRICPRPLTSCKCSILVVPILAWL